MTPEQFKAECCTEARPDGCPVLMAAKINQLEADLVLSNKKVKAYEELMEGLAKAVGCVVEHTHSLRLKAESLDHDLSKRSCTLPVPLPWWKKLIQ